MILLSVPPFAWASVRKRKWDIADECWCLNKNLFIYSVYEQGPRKNWLRWRLMSIWKEEEGEVQQKVSEVTYTLWIGVRRCEVHVSCLAGSLQFEHHISSKHRTLGGAEGEGTKGRGQYGITWGILEVVAVAKVVGEVGANRGLTRGWLLAGQVLESDRLKEGR